MDEDTPDTLAAAPGKRETLAELVRRLRDEAGLDQEGFCQLLGRSRTYVSGLETGRIVNPVAVKLLIAAFPHDEEAIHAAYVAALGPGQARTEAKRRGALRRRVDAFMQQGSFEYAERALRDGIRESGDDGEHHWMYDRLSAVLLARSKEPEALDALQTAVECAMRAGLRDEEFSSRARLARNYQRREDFATAHTVLDEGLVRFPDAGKLWLRKGKVYWYQGEYAAAYAALIAALNGGSRRRSVLHARAQVLADWGNYEAALVDIEAYFAYPDLTQVNVAYARSLRAYAWGLTGRREEAFADFQALEDVIPNSGWLYYRRALVHLAGNEWGQAAPYLERALQSSAPRLDVTKRRHVEELLAEFAASH